jgi:hypothetical protein
MRLSWRESERRANPRDLTSKGDENEEAILFENLQG